MKQSVSNFIMTFVGVTGDVIWYGILAYYGLGVIMNLTFWILSGVAPGCPFNHLDLKPMIIANFLLLISFAFQIIMVYYLRLLLKNISRKQFFFIENYRYLCVIGFALIFSNFAFYTLMIVLDGMEYFIRNEFSLVENIVINLYQMKSAILGIILLALAEVFRKGTLMQEEQQLTV